MLEFQIFKLKTITNTLKLHKLEAAATWINQKQKPARFEYNTRRRNYPNGSLDWFASAFDSEEETWIRKATREHCHRKRPSKEAPWSYNTGRRARKPDTSSPDPECSTKSTHLERSRCIEPKPSSSSPTCSISSNTVPSTVSAQTHCRRPPTCKRPLATCREETPPWERHRRD